MAFIRFIFTSLCMLMAASGNAAILPDASAPYVVSYVYDGDTVKLRNAEGEFKLRLTDIDAPERNQDYGLKSRRALIKLCQGSHILVTAQIVGTDKYNRSLGRLQCNHVDASTYLAERGLAWHYAQYSSDIGIYNAVLKARQQKYGLWASNKPIAPWTWRRYHPH